MAFPAFLTAILAGAFVLLCVLLLFLKNSPTYRNAAHAPLDDDMPESPQVPSTASKTIHKLKE